MSLLTVNAGSSSLKLAIYDDKATCRKATIAVERIGARDTMLRVAGSDCEKTIGARDHATAVSEVFRRLPELFSAKMCAIGHRLVHGGTEHHEPERITAALIDDLKKLQEIDRTHTPQALAVIVASTRHFPDVPQFVCFDTAFHRSIPEVAQRYSLPRWTAELGVRRYGFHGLSCESIVH